MDPLPSPSNMSVEDIPRILNGTIPQNDTNISLNQTTAIVHIQEVKTRLEKCLDNSTEMEATARVLLYVIEAAWELNNITIRMQPSIYKHSVFTDFLFIFGDDKLKAFIEVKRTDINRSHSTYKVYSTSFTRSTYPEPWRETWYCIICFDQL